jgi:hypothetical protein
MTLGALVVFTTCRSNVINGGLVEKDSGGLIVVVAVSDVIESTTAVTVTVGGAGGIVGVVYIPLASIVPQLAPEQPVPTTLQVITLLVMPHALLP